MAYQINFYQSNKADFIAEIIAVDVDTDEDIDLTGATVEITIKDDCDTVRVTATIANGLITQPATTVLKLNIPEATMANLRAGTYRIGGAYSLNSEINQIYVGNLVVYDGIVTL